MIDPAVVWIARAATALLFAAAALHKLRAPAAFAASVRDYALLPASLVRPFALAAMGVEASIAVALLVPATAAPAALAGAGLLAVYAAAIGINLARGRRDIDCGCFGPAAARRTLHGGLLARNAVLGIVALVAASPPSARALHGVDVVTIAGGLACAVLLGLAADTLADAASRARAAAPASVPVSAPAPRSLS